MRTRKMETREAPPVTLIIRCPKCGASALLRDVEDGKCPWCQEKVAS